MDTGHAGFVSRTSPVSEVERNMLEFLFASQNAPFVVAFALLLLIALLELASFVIGFGAGSAIDSVLPDLDADVDLDFDAGIDGANVEPLGGPIRALTWLGLGKVPVIILLAVFLGIFAFAGFCLQALLHSLTGGRFMLPGWLAWLPALLIAIPLVKCATAGLARVMPREETSAVSSRTFIGRVATIIIGTARSGSPAEAKLHDEHGQVHYIMVEPDSDTDVFETGTDVLLVNQTGATFRGIRNTSAAMVD